MNMEKLDHYFPEPTVRKLDRCKYNPSKVSENDEHRDELMALKEQIMYVHKVTCFVFSIQEKRFINLVFTVHMNGQRRPHV